MGSRKKKRSRSVGERRTSVWDAIIAATAAGWSATMRLFVLLTVLCMAVVAMAVLNAGIFTQVTRYFGA